MSIEILCAVILPGVLAILVGRGFPAKRSAHSFGGGMLGALGLLVLLPEVMEGFPLMVALDAFGFGLLLAWGLDRYVQPICPECSEDESWWRFAPLFGALAVHGLFDGAMIGVSRPGSFSNWVLVLHRVPEALTTYAMIESMGVPRFWVRWQMLGLQIVSLIGLLLARQLDLGLMTLAQGVVAGVLVYLGAHQLHHAWEERNMNWGAVGVGAACIGIVRWIV